LGAAVSEKLLAEARGAATSSSSIIYMCPHTTIYLSSYYYTFVLMLLYIAVSEKLVAEARGAATSSSSYSILLYRASILVYRAAAATPYLILLYI